MSSQPSSKRKRVQEPDTWECVACTYQNAKESFRCSICFTRKGTTSRKATVNNDVISQQQLIQQSITDVQRKKERGRNSNSDAVSTSSKQSSSKPPKLKNIDRTQTTLIEVFANGFSVKITEFKPKIKQQQHILHNQPSPASSESMSGFPRPNSRNLASRLSNMSSSSEDFPENVVLRNNPSKPVKRSDSLSSLEEEQEQEKQKKKMPAKRRGRPPKPKIPLPQNHQRSHSVTSNYSTPQSASSPIEDNRDEATTPKPPPPPQEEPMEIDQVQEQPRKQAINHAPPLPVNHQNSLDDISKNTSSMTDSIGASVLEMNENSAALLSSI